MEAINNSSLKFRKEFNKMYLVYNHEFGTAHLINQNVLKFLKKYYTDKKDLLKKVNKDRKLRELLNVLSNKRLI